VLAIESAFMATLGLYFPLFYLQVYAINQGINQSLAFDLFAILNAAGTIGRIIPNFFADRLGPLNVYITVLFVMGASIAAIAGVHTSASLIVVSLLYGFTSGAFPALIGPVLATTAKDVSEIGLRLGMGFFNSGFAVLIGTPISGALLTSDFHWSRPIIFSSVAVFVGAFLAVTARQIVSHTKHKSRV